MQMTIESLKSLTSDSVLSVYSGKDGKCCCGCAGKHRYNSKHIEAASKNRGYEVKAEEVNDKQVRRVLRLVQEGLLTGESVPEGHHAYRVINDRIYIVYTE